MGIFVLLVFVALGTALVFTWKMVTILIWNKSRDRWLRMAEPLPGTPPLGIEPPRVADGTVTIHYVPNPLNYREAVRVVEGLSENPLESVDLSVYKGQR